MGETDTRAVDEATGVLTNALTRDRVTILDATSKDAALRAMIDVLATSADIGNKREFTQAVFRREELMSTGIGFGLAIPHVRLAAVQKLVMAVGISRDGIADYGSLDDKPVYLIFLIAAPEGEHAEYLRLLSVISSRAKVLNGRLLACRDTESFFDVLTELRGENV